MDKETFGVVENEYMTIFCFSMDRKFRRKYVRRIFVQQYRMLHGNFFSFFLAIGILFFLKSDHIIANLICLVLILFSFFYKKIIHKLVIIEKTSFVIFRIDNKHVKDAEILINSFVNSNEIN